MEWKFKVLKNGNTQVKYLKIIFTVVVCNYFFVIFAKIISHYDLTVE